MAQRQHMLWTGIQAKLVKVYNLVKETMPKKPMDNQDLQGWSLGTSGSK